MERAERLQNVGKGSFGAVYRADYLGTEVAVKECFTSIEGQSLAKYLEREIEILKEARHPNVVQFMGLCKNESKTYIITEFVPGGNLKKVNMEVIWCVLRRRVESLCQQSFLSQWIQEQPTDMPWRLRVSFAVDVARALAYLHAKNIMHRDLKGENLLLTENNRIKVCDFGFSRVAARTDEERRRLSYCGTDGYMAPEIILGIEFDQSVDVFSFGCILCEILAQKVISEKVFPRVIPGFGINPAEVRSRALKGCPEGFINLAIACTSDRPRDRPSWKDILKRLKEIETVLPVEHIGVVEGMCIRLLMVGGRSIDVVNHRVSHRDRLKFD